ncbi:hypothetical protein HZA71_00525 [Candidatus Falkowbacteria bacterium]|nr:hypothetical protein [Candidatus Falkowbacteria bacterium]
MFFYKSRSSRRAGFWLWAERVWDSSSTIPKYYPHGWLENKKYYLKSRQLRLILTRWCWINYFMI